MSKKPENWNLKTEVLVVGSGGAGLTAAIVAHDKGAKVTVIERADKIGGTTSVSGAGLWMPLNHHMAERGFADSREDALKYCKNLAKGKASDELIETYVDTASEMLKYIEDHTPAKFESTKMPDYHMDIAGSKEGRNVGLLLFDTNVMGENVSNLRRNPFYPGMPITWSEIEKWEMFTKPQNVPFHILAERMEAGLWGFGEGLIACLYKACLDRGIEIILKTRALELIMDDDRVIGLLAQQDGRNWYGRAEKAVILASGGFEWNEELKAAFLPGPLTHPASPPFNEGDGLKMAMAAGAKLGNMTEIWGWSSVHWPGEEYEDRQLNRGIVPEKSLPHCIMVNRHGKRFVNEASSYSVMIKPMWHVDENTLEYANLPAWFIIDQQYHESYSFQTIMPGDPVPPWVDQADTLEGLADKVGIDAEGLKATVSRFNQFALEGVDHDFRRGKSLFDRYWGDKDHKPNPSLGTIEKPPFYALQAHVGCLGTKGGPKTNTKGQVLHLKGEPIPGLFAAGNTMAGVSGPCYWGGGGTIGPAMTFGYICGKNAAG